MAEQRLAPPRRIHEALPANQQLGDYPSVEDHGPGTDPDHQEQQRAEATEVANREIYNDFIGMFI